MQPAPHQQPDPQPTAAAAGAQTEIASLKAVRRRRAWLALASGVFLAPHVAAAHATSSAEPALDSALVATRVRAERLQASLPGAAAPVATLAELNLQRLDPE